MTPAPVVTPTPTPEPSAPASGVELKQDMVEDLADKAAKAEEGATITIDMTIHSSDAEKPATVVPAQILEEVKGKDVDLVFDMGDYSWSINGQDVEDTAKLADINLEVTTVTDVVPKKAVDSVVKNDEPTVQITLTHNGQFNFKATLNYYVGIEHAGKHANLYYYNNGALELIDAGEVDAKGYAPLDFNHASDYLIVMGEDHTMDVQPDTTPEPTPAPTPAPTPDSADDGDVDDAPKDFPMWIIWVVAAVAVVVVAVVVIVKRKDS